MEKSIAHISTNRNTGLDLLKIFACFAVVVIHVSANKWYDVDCTSFDWKVFTVYNCFSRWAVPVFVMISGSLFLKADYTVVRLYKKYILRIATAFLAWTCVYTAVNYIRYRNVPDAVKMFFSGDYHMWYLYMIAGLYMITPLLKKLVEDEKLTRYFLLLAFVFAFLIPEIISFVSMFSKYAASIMQDVISKIHLDFVLGYTFYYILGYYLTNLTLSKKQIRTAACLGIVGFIATLGMTVGFTYYKGGLVKLFYDYLTVNILLAAVPVFLLYNKFNKNNFSDKARHIITLLSKYSFGVYLVHVLLIYFLGYFLHLDTLSFNPILSVPVISIIVFTGSYIISAVLNNIPILKKYIV